MGFSQDFWSLYDEDRKKKKNRESATFTVQTTSKESELDDFSNEFWGLYDEGQKKLKDNDIAPVKGGGGGRSGKFGVTDDMSEEEKRKVELRANIGELKEELGYNDSFGKQLLSFNWLTDIVDGITGTDSERTANKKLLAEWEAELAKLNGKEEKKKSAWVKGGAFEDGWQAGDLLKTAGATVADTALGLVQGAGNTLEGITDLILHGVSKGADWVGADSVSDYLEKSADSNTVNNLADSIRNGFIEENTIYGDKGHGIPEAIGQILGLGKVSKTLQAFGWGAKAISAAVTTSMGASSMGSGISEAHNSDNQYEELAKQSLGMLKEQLSNGEITQEEYDEEKKKIDDFLKSNTVSDKDAWAYGAMKGVIDAGSELIFGGLGKSVNALGFNRGLSSLDDAFAKKLSNGLSKHIANKYAKRIVANGTEYIVKAGAEGLEEVMAAHSTALAKKLTYMSDEDLQKLVKDENALEQFLVSFVASAAMQGGGLVSSVKSDTDFVTGFTDNEQAVVNKEVEKRIAEEEKRTGKKLSNKAKNEIQEAVEKDLDKGYISIDTIEETLGGDSYKTYQDTVSKENALKTEKKAIDDEFQTLNRMKKGDMTGEQSDRLEELRAKRKELGLKIAENDKTSERDFLKRKYQNEVAEIARGSRLAESYREVGRRKQKFQADVSQYEGLARESIQSIIDKGQMQNTNKAHDVVDFAVKVASARGLKVTTTTTAEILAKAEQKHGRDYVIENFFETVKDKNGNEQLVLKSRPNAEIDGDTIALNVESPNLSRALIGHEISHSFEGTKYYKELADLLNSYAKDVKGEKAYNTQKSGTETRYKNVAGANAQYELNADLLGEYIFSDEGFVKHLAQNEKVFTGVLGRIKYMLKYATAGSQQQKDLLRIKRTFEQAWRDAKKGTNKNSAYNITALEDGKVYVTASRKVINGTTRAEQRSEISKFFSDLLQDNPSLDIHTIEGDVLTITKAETAHKARDDYKTVDGQPVKMTDEEFAVKLNVEAHIDEVAEVSRKIGQVADGKNHSFAQDGFTYRRAYFEDFDGQYYEVTLSIGHNGTVATVYNVGKIKEGIPPSAKVIAVVGSKPLGGKPSDSRIAQKEENVNSEFSLSDAQQEYFKDSVVRDDNGNLKVMYHGTSKGGHTVFDTYGSNYGLFGQGSYFTDSKDIAQSYTKKGKGNSPQVYESYLNITNPMDMDAQADPTAWTEAFPDADFPESGTNEDFYRAMEDYFEDNEYSRGEAAEIAMDALEGMGYDGITHIGGGRVNPDGTRHQVYIAFHPEQIKNIDNAKPTSNPDIRYSLAPVEAVEPSSDKWQRTYTTDEAMSVFPNMWNVAAEESEVRNPTQIRSTVNTYRNIYNILQSEGFNGTILDASSGLGDGTRAGIEEYGFDVEDIEPYPDSGYTPKYQDYSALDKKYDVIISNAVLNVLPQDQRDALVVKMGELLNDGGRMFINVRGNDVESLAKTGKNIHLGTREWIETVKGSYQKGFTKNELKAYLEDALGSEYTVEKSNKFGGVSVVVTKNGVNAEALDSVIPLSERFNENNSDIRYSLSEDSDGNALSEGQKEFFKDSKAVDGNGNLLKVYHTTKNDFTVFDDSKKGSTTEGYNTYLGHFFTNDPDYMSEFPDFKDGKTEAYYLNMKKPIDMNNISREAFLDIVEVTGGDVAEAAEIFDTMYAEEVERAKLRNGTPALELSNLLEELTGEYFFDTEFHNALRPNYDKLIAKGYDGVINNMDGAGWANEYVVLNSNQAKLTTNKNPTSDPDVRFSLSDVVEETKDLLVLHNLTESKLLKQLELDGFPMPSLAVTNQPHTNFGSISILFDKDTIDPKKNKKNKTYSADAWTPTFPRIEYEADRDVSHNFVETLRGLIDDSYYGGNVSTYLYDVEDSLNRNGGYEGYIDNLAEKPAIQYAFLKSKGENVEIAQKAKEVDLGFHTEESMVNRYKAIINDFSGDVSAARKMTLTELAENSPTIKALLERVSSRSNMQQLSFIGRVLDQTIAYQNYDPNAVVETEYIPDYSQTNKDMQARIDTNELKSWLKEQTNGIVANSGVYNGKEIFTPSGNRRSFKQLHYPVTVENIVKSMESQGEKSVTSFNGVKTLRATTAKTFKSIAEIQKAKGKLQNLSEAEVEQIHNELSDQMFEVFNKIIGENPKMFRKDDIFALDTIGEVLSEVENENINASYIKGVFNKYGYNLSSETADDCFKLLDAISSMPVYIFEAKPRRVVGYDEIKAVVIPEDTSAELKDTLTQRGINFVEYDGTEADRQAKLKEVATANDSYFSLSDANAEATPTRDDVPFNSLRYEGLVEDIAPVETAQEPVTKTTENLFPDDYAPMSEDEGAEQERLGSLTDADIPPEVEAPYTEESITPDDPFEERDIGEAGNRKVKAYMYENPEVKPFFQEEANIMLGELEDTVKGERIYSDEGGWTGTSRFTSDDIAYLRDSLGYTYAEIEKGLKDIIEDNGKENNACSKRIEFILHDRLFHGYSDFRTGLGFPSNKEYINLVKEKQITDYSREAWDSLVQNAEQYAPPTEDIAPIATENVQNMRNSATENVQYEAIRPQRATEVDEDIAPIGENVEYGDRLVRADSPFGKERKWVGTSTESETVNRQILPDDLDQTKIHYQPISNKTTLGNANAKLDGMGYESTVNYFNSQFANKSVSLDDVALGERLIQEALKRGDTKTAGELIQNVAILGTELGQKVQALSIIKRLTPEGQLKMLQKTVERGKTKKDKAFEGVEFTQEMIDKILKVYGKDGSYDQKRLNEAVEEVKKDIADQMKVTKMDKVNAWRYLSMLGNPKTHIRNLVSNVAMKGTVAVKNALARTIETVAPIKNRTKTWKAASEDVKAFSQKTTAEMKDILSVGGKYNESESIKAKRQIFKNKILNGLYEFNSDMLTKEDWWFSKSAFQSSLSEYLTANGIRTAEDIQNNPEVVEKAKLYATEQSQIATFRQYSYLANKISEFERHNTATQIAVGAVLPFKKTPINIAKTGLNYSPLGFIKTLTSDVNKVKNGKMEASELVDHLSQNITGTALTLVGYMLASAGFISGGGEDDKEGEYDYQLGEQSYSLNIGGQSYSLSWLSPVAMPMFVGANAYEQLVEGKEWNGDVVVETLAQTLDPLSEMSFLSGLNQVLSSYDSGIEKFAGIGESMAQNYITQFVPTLSSQVATVMDDTKRSTKVAADSDFRFLDQTINQLKYKIPGLRQTLEPSTDIWGNEVKQTDNLITRAVETFIAPYARRENIATEIDAEIKSLYSQTGDGGVIPSIPRNTVNYKDEKYEMSASDYTAFKKTYGQTAYNLMEGLFATEMYQNASSEEKAELVNKVYDYASDVAKREYLARQGVSYTNAKKDDTEYYKEDAIKGAIENDMHPDEYSFYVEYPEKYAFFKDNDISYSDYASADEEGKRAYTWAYENPGKYKASKVISSDFSEYYRYKSDMDDLTAKDEYGNTVSGLKKERVINYISGLDLEYGQKILLLKMQYKADDTYNYEIIDYLNNRADVSYEDMITILKELGFKIGSDGVTVTWD